MALIGRNVTALFENITPFIQIKRFRGKINIQRPRPPHFERAKYLAVTKPYFRRKDEKPLVALCNKNVSWNKTEIENPFQRFLANDLLHFFKTSRLIAFYHMNPMSGEQHFKAYALFKKQNMLYKNYGKKTLEMAVKGTRYEPVTEFYVSHNMMVFSPEVEIKKLLKISKKFPQLILLAAILEGNFISRDELQKYSLIPNIQTAQLGLVQTLNSIGGQVALHLTSHQNTLVSQLQERCKQLEEEK